MVPELEPLRAYMKALWTRLQLLHEDDRGMTTETVIITAALAGAAVIAVGVIISRITSETDTIAP